MNNDESSRDPLQPQADIKYRICTGTYVGFASYYRIYGLITWSTELINHNWIVLGSAEEISMGDGYI